jgi:4a-hydroxytetrahydrobiopterin dehydratase
MKLAERHCKEINKKSPPLAKERVGEYLRQLDKKWKIAGKKIKRIFIFDDYLQAVEFVNQVAKVARKENHHPDIHLFYKEVIIELATHAVDGLSENDFILAAKIDRLT